MAIKPRKHDQTFQYVLAADRGSETQTKFIVRRLRWDEMDELNLQAVYSPDQALKVTMLMIEARAGGRGPDQLTADEMRRLNEIAPHDHAFRARLHQYYAAVVRMGLVEVRDVIDEQDNAQTMKAADFIRCADAEQFCEVGAEILRLSRHGEGELKN